MTDTQYTADELREVADQTWSEFSGRSGFLYDNYVRGLLKTGADAMDALAKAEARVKVLKSALLSLSDASDDAFRNGGPIYSSFGHVRHHAIAPYYKSRIDACLDAARAALQVTP